MSSKAIVPVTKTVMILEKGYVCSDCLHATNPYLPQCRGCGIQFTGIAMSTGEYRQGGWGSRSNVQSAFTGLRPGLPFAGFVFLANHLDDERDGAVYVRFGDLELRAFELVNICEQGALDYQNQAASI
jgi:hypothetical protein